MSTHKLSKQLGTSSTMIANHYSKISPLANADEHGGRKWTKGIAALDATCQAANAEQLSKAQALVFAMLHNGLLTFLVLT